MNQTRLLLFSMLSYLMAFEASVSKPLPALTPEERISSLEFIRHLNSHTPSFLKLDQNTIIVPRGKWTLTQPWRIEKGWQVVIEPGVQMDFQKGSGIYSKSPLEIRGTAKEPVTFFSSDNTGQGVMLFEVGQPREFEHLHVTGLTGIHVPSLGKRSLLLAIGSKLILRRCVFKDLKKVSALTFYKSEFDVRATAFAHIKGRALDSFQSEGQIFKTSVENLGGGGMLFEASQVSLRQMRFENVYPYVLVAQNNSTLKLHQTLVENFDRGFNLEDQSVLEAQNLTLKKGITGFLLAKREALSDSSYCSISDYESQEVKKEYVLQKGTMLKLNDVTHRGTQEKVHATFLPLLSGSGMVF